ncbi:MAG: GGDEF domain-containing protein, partial [Bacteroidetes bacterium]
MARCRWESHGGGKASLLLEHDGLAVHFVPEGEAGVGLVPPLVWRSTAEGRALFQPLPCRIEHPADASVQLKKALDRAVPPTTDELQALAMRDGLTGVLNRRAFDRAFEDEVLRSRRYDLPLSVILMDIDHFKRINDTFGHQAGDVCLVEVARMVSGLIRTSDRLA